MLILLGILQSFFNATGMVLLKLVVENKTIGNNWQTFISRANHFIVLIFLFSIAYFFIDIKQLTFNLPSDFFVFQNIVLLLFSCFLIYLTYPLRRIAYANEKVSVLQPFAMLYQVFPIIIGFIFITSERANTITFIMALLASAIVIIPSINWKTFRLNKYSLMILTSSIIKGGQIFIVLYFLTIISPINFYLLETIIIILFSIFLIFIKNEFSEIKLITRKYAKLLFIANFVVIFSILISLTLLSTLGIVATSLLGLLYLVFVYILGFIILKEIPSKKDIIITILVSICIIVGMLFQT